MSDTVAPIGSKRKSRGSSDSGKHVVSNGAKRHSESNVPAEETSVAAGVKVSFKDVTAAAFRIKSGIQKTPLVKSFALSSILGLDLYFKKEYELRTGSFKERGARNALLKLSAEGKEKGVIAASAGNHALALAYHGGLLGISITVVMPLVAPIMKISQCQHMGATVIMHGATIAEAKDHAYEIKETTGQVYVNGYDDLDIIAGQGTIGLEICEQLGDCDAIIVPVGGAGLIAGVAVAAKNLNPAIKIIAVEAHRCRSFSAAIKAGRPVYTTSHVSLADGLAVPTVGINAFATAQPLVDKTVTVSERAIALSILRLVEIEKAVVEGSGVVGLAALLDGLLPELLGKKVVTILCGGNIDTTVLGRVLERGLAADNRLLSFTVVVKDAPGGVNSLTQLLADLGASIKDILHERAWLLEDVFAVRVRCVVETKDSQHAETLKERLISSYKHVEFVAMSDHSTDTRRKRMSLLDRTQYDDIPHM